MDNSLILLFVIAALLVINLLVVLFKKNEGGSREMISEFAKFSSGLEQVAPLIRTESSTNREEFNKSSKASREELNDSLKVNRKELTDGLNLFREQVSKSLDDFNETQRLKFNSFGEKQDNLKKDTEEKLEKIRETVETKLQALQEDNSKKLEKMRETVDEKLQASVEKRFSESFKLISERLDTVHAGLGEMQKLAVGVGDLKKVLTNVKTRGSLGEIQLGAILEQILSPEQYEHNALIKEGSQERVEYVIKFPGKSQDDKSLLLPIDSKFPNEDYQRLVEVYDDVAGIEPKEFEAASKQFESSIKRNAKNICEKYINPPVTTDFAIMFVPTEGLYAEVLRRPALFEVLQRDYKITVVGPTNLAALLNSLQMGFRTLAIEKRSSEVWEILAAVKTSFGKFGDILDKTKKKLQEAANTIDDASSKSRTIERKLRTVQDLPEAKAVALLEDTIPIEIGDLLDVEVQDSNA
ncbi:MAG TPA: DNA recombination protein RmuC [Pyrinomonadaceae bacterium]|nr:DNA recombination protein RmuC [Pyrinomonadaceae bacterium]